MRENGNISYYIEGAESVSLLADDCGDKKLTLSA